MFAGFLLPIVTHVRRIACVPDLTLTFHYCPRWCTRTSSESVESVGGNRTGSCYRKTRQAGGAHAQAKSDANTMLLCVAWCGIEVVTYPSRATYKAYTNRDNRNTHRETYKPAVF